MAWYVASSSMSCSEKLARSATGTAAGAGVEHLAAAFGFRQSGLGHGDAFGNDPGLLGKADAAAGGDERLKRLLALLQAALDVRELLLEELAGHPGVVDVERTR